MKTEMAFDIMEKILPDVVEIVNDPELEAVRVKLDPKNSANIKALMPEVVPLFIKKHRTAMVNILAAAAGKTAEEINEQPFEKTAVLTTATFIEEIMLFFAFCLRMAMHA